MFVYDDEIERSMGLGRAWPYAKLGKGECYMPLLHAQRLRIGKGDKVIVAVTANYLLGNFWNKAVREYGSQGNHSRPQRATLLVLPFTVKDTYSQPFGKHQSGLNNAILVERDGFMSYVRECMNPNFPTNFLAYWNQFSSFFEMTTQIVINLAPDVRLATYVSTDLDSIRQKMVSFSTNVLYALGFDMLDSSLPVYNELSVYQMFSVFLGITINIIIFFLCYLGVMLIYSLMMISVDSRRFEMGLTRMVFFFLPNFDPLFSTEPFFKKKLGLTRTGLIKLLIVQGISYAIPAWFFGILAAQILMVGVNNYFVSKTSVGFNAYLSLRGIATATLLGLLMPLVSSIAPIREALSENIHDSIDTRRSKIKVVRFELER